MENIRRRLHRQRDQCGKFAKKIASDYRDKHVQVHAGETVTFTPVQENRNRQPIPSIFFRNIQGQIYQIVQVLKMI